MAVVEERGCWKERGPIARTPKRVADGDPRRGGCCCGIGQQLAESDRGSHEVYPSRWLGQADGFGEEVAEA